MFHYQNENLIKNSIKFDPLHEDVLEKTNYKGFSNVKKAHANYWLFCGYLGLLELFLINQNSTLRKNFLNYFDENNQKILKYHLLHSSFWKTQIEERKEINESSDQLKEISIDKKKPKSILFLSNGLKNSALFDFEDENTKFYKTNYDNTIQMFQSDDIKDKIINILNNNE